MTKSLVVWQSLGTFWNQKNIKWSNRKLDGETFSITTNKFIRPTELTFNTAYKCCVLMFFLYYFLADSKEFSLSF